MTVAILLNNALVKHLRSRNPLSLSLSLFLRGGEENGEEKERESEPRKKRYRRRRRRRRRREKKASERRQAAFCHLLLRALSGALHASKVASSR